MLAIQEIIRLICGIYTLFFFPYAFFLFRNTKNDDPIGMRLIKGIGINILFYLSGITICKLASINQYLFFSISIKLGMLSIAIGLFRWFFRRNKNVPCELKIVGISFLAFLFFIILFFSTNITADISHYWDKKIISNYREKTVNEKKSCPVNSYTIQTNPFIISYSSYKKKPFSLCYSLTSFQPLACKIYGDGKLIDQINLTPITSTSFLNSALPMARAFYFKNLNEPVNQITIEYAKDLVASIQIEDYSSFDPAVSIEQFKKNNIFLEDQGHLDSILEVLSTMEDLAYNYFFTVASPPLPYYVSLFLDRLVDSKSPVRTLNIFALVKIGLLFWICFLIIHYDATSFKYNNMLFPFVFCCVHSYLVFVEARGVYPDTFYVFCFCASFLFFLYKKRFWMLLFSIFTCLSRYAGIVLIIALLFFGYWIFKDRRIWTKKTILFFFSFVSSFLVICCIYGWLTESLIQWKDILVFEIFTEHYWITDIKNFYKIFSFSRMVKNLFIILLACLVVPLFSFSRRDSITDLAIGIFFIYYLLLANNLFMHNHYLLPYLWLSSIIGGRWFASLRTYPLYK